MAVTFQDVDKSFSETLRDLAASLTEEQITVRQLLGMIGEHGILMFCMVLTIPFLTPIPLPGISTVFGFLIMLVSISIILNRVPWLPGFLMNRTMQTKQLKPVLESGAKLFTRIERIIRPRLGAFSGNALANRFNGLMLFGAGFLLIIPLPVLPLSNFLPGWAVLLLAAGMLQRDGLLILVAYALILITFVYFGAVAIGVVLAGESLMKIFTEPTATAAPTAAPTPGLWLYQVLRSLF